MTAKEIPTNNFTDFRILQWKERFKAPTTPRLKAGERRGKQKASEPDSTYASPTDRNADLLPPPPISLEEICSQPARNTAIPAMLGRLAPETDTTTAFPEFEEDAYSEEGVFEPDDVVYSNTSQRVVAVELPTQTIGIDRLNGKADRSTDLKIPLRENGGEAEVNLSVPKESTLPSRKRKRAYKVPSDEDTITTIDEPKKRKRTEKHKGDTIESPDQLNSEPLPHVEAPARKRGRPKKKQPSNSKVTTKKQKPPAPVDKNPAESAPVNGHVLRRGKRKMSTSEDELSMPLPKRQINAKKGATASAAESTKKPVARRSSRRK